MVRNLLLQGDVLWTQEHRDHLSADGKQGLKGPYQEHPRGICGWYVGESVQRTEHLQHLNKTFNLFKQYEGKLNVEKCTSGVAYEKFLGHPSR